MGRTGLGETLSLTHAEAADGEATKNRLPVRNKHLSLPFN